MWPGILPRDEVGEDPDLDQPCLMHSNPLWRRRENILLKNMMYWTNFAFWNMSNNISDIFHHSNITGFMPEKFKSLTFIKFLSTAASFLTTWTIKLLEKYILNLWIFSSVQFSSGVEMLKITAISCNYSTKIKRKLFSWK